jgi:hypothetical protein
VQSQRHCARLFRMAVPTFKLVPQPDRSFSVSLTTAEGRLKTIDGFDSEHEAEAWIVQIKRTFYETNPLYRPPTRPESGHRWPPSVSRLRGRKACKPEPTYPAPTLAERQIGSSERCDGGDTITAPSRTTSSTPDQLPPKSSPNQSPGSPGRQVVMIVLRA